jgi:hypothetical protein
VDALQVVGKSACPPGRAFTTAQIELDRNPIEMRGLGVGAAVVNAVRIGGFFWRLSRCTRKPVSLFASSLDEPMRMNPRWPMTALGGAAPFLPAPAKLARCRILRRL